MIAPARGPVMQVRTAPANRARASLGSGPRQRVENWKFMEVLPGKYAPIMPYRRAKSGRAGWFKLPVWRGSPGQEPCQQHHQDARTQPPGHTLDEAQPEHRG